MYERTCYSVAHAVVAPLHDLLVLVGAVHDAGGGILSNSVTVVLRLDLHLTITVHTHTHTQCLRRLKELYSNLYGTK